MEILKEVEVLFNKVSSESQNCAIELAYKLARVSKEQLYTAGGYSSFNQYLSALVENSNKTYSKSYLYQLKNLAESHEANEQDLREKINTGTVSLTTLLNEDRKAKLKDAANDEDVKIKVPIFLSKEDAKAFHTALLVNAVANGISTINESMLGLALSGLMEGSQKILSSNMNDDFKNLLGENRFYCGLCGQIPRDPAMHHIYPSSAGGKSGPKMLLCNSTCHLSIVQPKWKQYAKKWMGKETHEEYLNKIKNGEEIPFALLSGKSNVFDE